MTCIMSKDMEYICILGTSAFEFVYVGGISNWFYYDRFI